MSAVYIDMPDGLYTGPQIRAWFLLAGLDSRLPSSRRDVLITYPLALGGKAFRISRSLAEGPAVYRVESQG